MLSGRLDDKKPAAEYKPSKAADNTAADNFRNLFLTRFFNSFQQLRGTLKTLRTADFQRTLRQHRASSVGYCPEFIMYKKAVGMIEK